MAAVAASRSVRMPRKERPPGIDSELFDMRHSLFRVDAQGLFSCARGLCRPSSRHPSSLADPQKTTSPVSWAATMMSLLVTVQQPTGRPA